MKIKRLWALLTAALVLCGCGSGESGATLEGQAVAGREGTLGEQENSTNVSAGVQGDSAGGTSFSYVQPEMKGEISVSCLYPEEFLSIAAEQFMKMYPDVKVTINSYMESAGSGTNVLPVEDYQTYLNTKIMTGKAEDILFVNFLPITKYSEMEVFEDLSGYIQAMPEMNDDNYFMNALCAAEQGSGELYVVPYKVRFETIALSTVKAVAWEFLRYLLSDEVQSLPSLHGLSANRKGMEAAVERYYSFYINGNGGTGYDSAAMYSDLLVNWMEQINDCDTLDTAVMTLIEEENKKYFAGQQSAEDTARRIQRQLEQYFKE